MKRRTRYLATGLAVLAAMLVRAATASAAQGAPPAPKTLSQVIDNTRVWAVGLLVAVGTLFLVLGALRYMIAGGDPGEVERAKLAIKGALIGYALALLAPALLSVVQGIVG